MLICVIMSFRISAVEFAYSQTSDGLVYSINENNEAIIEGYSGYVNKVAIPDEIDGKLVKYIKEYAFYNNENITKIEISDNVIEIGDEAFGNCVELQTVKLPGNLQKISKGLFYKCAMLTNIELPEGLTVIEDFAFEGCVILGDLKIPASVTEIGHEVFITCENLILDCSDNDYAYEYAKSNNIKTEGSIIFDNDIFKVAVITLIILIAGFVCYNIIRKVKKNNSR